MLMKKPSGIKTRTRQEWQVFLRGMLTLAAAVLTVLATGARAADDQLPALLPVAASPAVIFICKLYECRV